MNTCSIAHAASGLRSPVKSLPALRPYVTSKSSTEAAAEAAGQVAQGASGRIDPKMWIQAYRAPLPGSTWAALAVATAFLAACVALAPRAMRALDQEAGLKATVRDLDQRALVLDGERVAIESELELLRGDAGFVVEQGPFKLCNLSSVDLVVPWLSVTYFDERGAARTWDSSQVGYPTWEVSSGGSQAFEWVSGDRVVWDGTTSLFTVLVRYRGSELLLSGVWSDTGGDCYKLALDQ